MSSEPPSETHDTRPSAESGEFENFFERGALGAYEDGPARIAEQQAQAELDGAPLITLEQLARRGRLQRGVTVLVTSLGVASLVLFASQALHAPPTVSDDKADLEPVSVPVKAVSTSLGAARSQPTPAPLAPEPAVRDSAASTEPAPAPAGAPAAPDEPATESAAPMAAAHRTTGVRALAVRAGEPPRRPAPFRAASAPARAALARPGQVAEPSATASFPVDRQ